MGKDGTTFQKKQVHPTERIDRVRRVVSVSDFLFVCLFGFGFNADLRFLSERLCEECTHRTDNRFPLLTLDTSGQTDVVLTGKT